MRSTTLFIKGHRVLVLESSLDTRLLVPSSYCTRQSLETITSDDRRGSVQTWFHILQRSKGGLCPRSTVLELLSLSLVQTRFGPEVGSHDLRRVGESRSTRYCLGSRFEIRTSGHDGPYGRSRVTREYPERNISLSVSSVRSNRL